jgi:hypothetical protein
LSDPADEEATRKKAVQVAGLIEGLAGSRSVGGDKKEGNGRGGHGVKMEG